MLVWRDGSTIAFREEIIQIIEWLAPNGLPPFGAIVFLLASCKSKVPALKDIIGESSAPLPAKMGGDAAGLRAITASDHIGRIILLLVTIICIRDANFHH